MSEILSCPTPSTICGSSNVVTLTSTSDTQTFGVESGQTLDAMINCNWLVKSAYGPPAVKWTGGNSGIAVEMFMVQYTADSRNTLVNTHYPQPDADPFLIDTNCGVANQCSATSDTNGPVIAYKKSGSTIVSTSDIKSDYSAYNTKKTTYEDNVKTAEDDYSIFNWFLFQFAPEYPEYVGAYTGDKWSSLTSLGGWGDYTLQQLEKNNKYVPFGVMGGQTTYDPSSGTAAEASFAYDTNTATTATRYTSVMVITTSGA
jgi:hypothetical protein